MVFVTGSRHNLSLSFSHTCKHAHPPLLKDGHTAAASRSSCSNNTSWQDDDDDNQRMCHELLREDLSTASQRVPSFFLSLSVPPPVRPACWCQSRCGAGAGACRLDPVFICCSQRQTLTVTHTRAPSLSCAHVTSGFILQHPPLQRSAITTSGCKRP